MKLNFTSFVKHTKKQQMQHEKQQLKGPTGFIAPEVLRGLNFGAESTYQ